MRRGETEKQLCCTYAKGEPASSLHVTTRKEGWGGMGGGQRGCGWLVGWNEQRKVGEGTEEYSARTQTTRKSPGIHYNTIDTLFVAA